VRAQRQRRQHFAEAGAVEDGEEVGHNVERGQTFILPGGVEPQRQIVPIDEFSAGEVVEWRVKIRLSLKSDVQGLCATVTNGGNPLLRVPPTRVFIGSQPAWMPAVRQWFSLKPNDWTELATPVFEVARELATNSGLLGDPMCVARCARTSNAHVAGSQPVNWLREDSPPLRLGEVVSARCVRAMAQLTFIGDRLICCHCSRDCAQLNTKNDVIDNDLYIIF
jgi:hypothetical protein